MDVLGRGKLKCQWLGVRQPAPLPEAAGANLGCAQPFIASVVAFFITYFVMSFMNAVLGIDTIMWWCAFFLTMCCAVASAWTNASNWSAVLWYSFGIACGGHFLFWIMQYMD